LVSLASNEVVFVNFYANWCRFSQMLNPIYDQFADKVEKEFPVCWKEKFISMKNKSSFDLFSKKVLLRLEKLIVIKNVNDLFDLLK
jgi:endoplasmic reticulum resident protein 44